MHIWLQTVETKTVGGPMHLVDVQILTETGEPTRHFCTHVFCVCVYDLVLSTGTLSPPPHTRSPFRIPFPACTDRGKHVSACGVTSHTHKHSLNTVYLCHYLHTPPCRCTVWQAHICCNTRFINSAAAVLSEASEPSPGAPLIAPFAITHTGEEGW